MQPDQNNSYVEPILTAQDIPGSSGVNPNPNPAPTQTPPTPPVSTPTPPTTNSGPAKKILLILGAIVLIILLSLGAFFAYRTFVAGNQTATPKITPTIITTATPLLMPTLTPISSSSPSASPIATGSGTPTTGEGSIVGTLCYPSETIPAGKVVAKDISKNTTISFDNPQNNASFLITLPVGQYKLKYDPNTGSDGYYTTCTGTEAVCQNNTTKRASIVTTVISGQSSSGVKICDYYYAAGMEPDF